MIISIKTVWICMNIFESHVNKYEYTKSQNCYKYILYNLIDFDKCISNTLKCIIIISKYWFYIKKKSESYIIMTMTRAANGPSM